MPMPQVISDVAFNKRSIFADSSLLAPPQCGVHGDMGGMPVKRKAHQCCDPKYTRYSLC
jgi:hypothetical protein